MVLSDTHEAIAHQLDVVNMPAVDVVLHSGYLTHEGGPDALERSMDVLANIPAKQRLIISGNHDLTLDKEYRAKNSIDEEGMPGQYYKPEGQYEDDLKIQWKS